MENQDEQRNLDEQESQVVIPLTQETITFQEKPIIVVRLPGGKR